MSQTPPPAWPHGAPPPPADASPFQPLQPPPPFPAGQQPYAGLPPAPGSGPGSLTGPLGAPPASVSIEDFRPKRSLAPVLVVAITVALVVAAVVAAVFLSARPAKPSASATPTSVRPSATSTRTPALPGQGIPWESNYDHAAGYWEITKQTWQADGVVLALTITVDRGTITPSFYVFDNSTTTQYRVQYTNVPTPALSTSSMSAPQSYSGNVFVPMPHADGTLIMVSSHQVDAISALPVRG